MQQECLIQRGIFLFELQKGYCFCLYLNDETGSFVLYEVIIRGLGLMVRIIVGE